MKFLQEISKLFGKEASETTRYAVDQPVAKNQDDARIIHDVLLVLLPPDWLEEIAFDDYYPMMLYGLRDIPGGGRDFVEAVQGFQDRLHAQFFFTEKADKIDMKAFTKLCEENSEILLAVKRVLEMPAGELDSYCGNQLSLVRPPEQTVQQHLADNVRFKALHTEHLERFIEVVKQLDSAQPALQNGSTSGFRLPRP